MLVTILVASILITATTAVHAVGMVAAVAIARSLWKHNSDHPLFLYHRPIRVSVVVLLMFLVSVLEVIIWATTYLLLGLFDGLEPAVYFSMVTFTTLGYGDLVLEENWRLLASFQAANGIIMFGWTTAVVIAVVQRVYGWSDSGEK